MDSRDRADASLVARARRIASGALGELLRRILRVRIDRLPRSLRAVIVVLWAVWVALAVVLLLPGAVEPLEDTGSAEATAFPTGDGGFLAVWTVLIATTALSAGAAVVLLVLRTRPGAAVGAVAVALAACAVPAFFLAGAVAFPALAATLVIAVAAVALTVRAAIAGPEIAAPPSSPSAPSWPPAPALNDGGRRSRRGSRDLLAALAGLAVVGAWAPLAVDAFTSAVPLSLVSSYAVLGSAAVAVTGFATIAGVASAAESANATTGTVERRQPGRLVSGLILALVVVVLISRYTVLNGVFGELEAELWSLRDGWSWPHAALIAAIVVVAALRSARIPFSARGQRSVTLIVSLAAGVSNLVLVALALVLFVLLFTTGTVADPGEQLGFVHVVALAVVLVLAVFVLRRRYRRSTGRVGAVVGLVFLVPFAGSLAFALRAAGVPVFWASPTQVILLVVAVAVVLFVLGELPSRAGRRWVPTSLRTVDRGMLLRLAVIPVVTVHAGELIPAVWDDALSRPVVVVLSFLAFLLLGPVPSADARLTARRIIAASALQVAILGTFSTSIVLDYDAQAFTVVAVIWLALPVSAMLVCRVVAVPLRSPEVPRSALQETSSASAFSMRR